MRLEHHLVGGYVRYISPHIIIIIVVIPNTTSTITVHAKFVKGQSIFLGENKTHNAIV